MENRELVERLLKGQQNIDRMKREIRQLVAMIIGHMKSESFQLNRVIPAEGELNADNSPCMWTILYEEPRFIGVTKHVQIRCFLRGSTDELMFDSLKDEIKLYHVQNLHGGLPALVGGIVSHFPRIQEYWSPLIGASRVDLE